MTFFSKSGRTAEKQSNKSNLSEFSIGRKLRLLSPLLLSLILPFQSANAAPTFTNLSGDDFDKISRELSGNFMHHSVQGAAPLGAIFGFEVGLVAGQEPTPNISSIVKAQSGSDFPNLYHAGILGVVSVPFGLTGEAMILPKQSSSNGDFQSTSLALKLSLNKDLLKFLPFNLALRGFSSNSNFSFTQVMSGANATVQNTNTVTGVQLLLSPSLPIVEPYVGVGYLTSKNTLNVTGVSTSIFAPGYTTAQSADNSLTTTQLFAGVTAKLLFFSLGAEYSNAFGANTYTGKLAFGF